MMATSVCNAQNLTGSGTESEPYLISTQSDLEIFANNVNSGISYEGKFIKLTDNIECDYNEDIQWTPIGDDNNSFQGTFDGNGKTISRLYFDNSNQIYVGLFGYNEGTIKNVGVVKSNFKGKQAVGGVCGYNYYGTITNCYNTGEVSGSDNISGVCGFTFYGTITNCYNTGEVSGSQYISGVCGYNLFGTITNCYYLSDADNGNEDKTQEQFANGEVAYKLGGAFFQTIGEDASPVLNSTHGVVYQTTGCSRIPYSNTENDFIEHINFDGNGFCSVCGGGYEPAKYSDENGVYQIANAGNLYWFAQYVNKGGNNSSANAVLISDIVVNENLLSSLEKDEDGNVTNVDDFKEWILIGNLDVYYKGTFDGNGHTISGLYFNKSNQYNVGLFGQITGNAVIKNVGVIDSYFKGDAGVGGVCGDNDSSKGLIENCYNASIVIGKNYVGGVCGDNSGTITNCYNAGGIEGHYSYSYTGGVCGFSENTIINCYNIGDIEGYYNTGGVCGSNKKLIKNCYNIGEVNGDEKTGGVCGDNYYGTIQYCHNVGMVNSEHYYIGGVCGYNSSGTIQHCYFNSDIYQGDASNGDDTDETVAGKSSADFKNLVIGLLNVNGNNVWGQGLSYPMLISNHVHEYSNGFCMVCNVCQQPEQDENDVYQIANVGNLYWFANYVNQGGDNANAFLANDIVVNENLLSLLGKDKNGNVTNGANFKAWNPMGYYIDGSNYVSYAGTFDGNGHTISGLYFNDSSRELVGLFGRTTEGASIKNVGVVDSYFKGGDYVGGVCGMNGDTITNCYNTGEVNGSGSSVGGVCGYNYNVPITNCYNTGEVSGGNSVGGVCGNNKGPITNCYYLETSANTGIGEGDGEATAKTATQFASGEVAYQLGDAFYQKIGEDTLPVLNSTHGKVYLASPCIAYSNTENAVAEHEFGENGFCTVCGAYEPASEDENGVYQIANAGNLYWFANYVNDMANAEYKNVFYQSSANAVLTANITVNENLLKSLAFDENGNVTNGANFGEWSLIGYYNNYNDNVYYAGTFDGNGHTISGLYFNDSNREGAGLIGLTTEGAVIKNVGVIDSYFKGKYYVGGVCGDNNGGTITNCYNTGSVNGNNNVGGVCGCYLRGTITNCYNTGEVNGNGDYVGGVCGYKEGGTITNCYNTGSVKGNSYVGGVCGDNSGIIENCYNTGSVNGNGNYIGGVCGENYGPITNCYNMGAVTCDESFVGGISGNNNGSIINCYNIAEIKGAISVGGICGSIGNDKSVVNCYNNGNVSGSDKGGICGQVFNGTIENCYYLSGIDAVGYSQNTLIIVATAKTAIQFADGTVAQALRDGRNGDVWGQYLGVDESPKFRGKIVNPTKITAENREEYNLGEDYIGYYALADVDDLYWFANFVNQGGDNAKAQAILKNDIVANENLLSSLEFDEDGNVTNGSNFKQWIPIGTENQKFNGTFDGAGHTISGLYFNQDASYAGLFGRSTQGGSIKNVGVVDSYIKGKNNVGGIVEIGGNVERPTGGDKEDVAGTRVGDLRTPDNHRRYAEILRIVVRIDPDVILDPCDGLGRSADSGGYAGRPDLFPVRHETLEFDAGTVDVAVPGQRLRHCVIDDVLGDIDVVFR